MREASTPIKTMLTALALPASSARAMASRATTLARALSFSTMFSGYAAAPVMTGMGMVSRVLVMMTPSFFRYGR